MQLNRLEIVGHHGWLRPPASVSLGEVHADSGALQHHSSASAIVDHCRHSADRVNKLDVPLPLVVACQVRTVQHQLVIFFGIKLCQPQQSQDKT